MDSGKHKATWNPWSSFDVSAEEIDKIKRRQAIMAGNKAEFRRITLDPQKLLSGGRGGHIVCFYFKVFCVRLIIAHENLEFSCVSSVCLV